MARHGAATLLAALALVLVAAQPGLAGAPERWTEVIEDSYVLAECDGYEVVQFNVVTLAVAAFEDRPNDEARVVTHADTVGVVRRVYEDGSTLDVATYRDRGGIFVEGPGDTFTWTGIIDRYELRDGTMLVNIGYQQLRVLSWDPFEAEWVRDVGRYTLDSDPCTW